MSQFDVFISPIERSHKHDVTFHGLRTVEDLPGYDIFVEKMKKLFGTSGKRNGVYLLYHFYGFSKQEVEQVLSPNNQCWNETCLKIRIAQNLDDIINSNNISDIAFRIDRFIEGYRSFRNDKRQQDTK